MNQRESIETLRGGCLEIFYTSVECGREDMNERENELSLEIFLLW
jgi:hypothetical protein